MKIEIIAGHDKYIDSFYECFDQVCRERRYLSFLEAPPKNEVAEFARSKITNGNTLFYAIENNVVVGWCDILKKGPQTLSHSGVLGIGIKPGYRGVGIGKRILDASIQDAFERGLERIELWVFENNQPAIALYKFNGFKVEGKMEKYIKIDGVHIDALLMSKIK